MISSRNQQSLSPLSVAESTLDLTVYHSVSAYRTCRY